MRVLVFTSFVFVLIACGPRAIETQSVLEATVTTAPTLMPSPTAMPKYLGRISFVNDSNRPSVYAVNSDGSALTLLAGPFAEFLAWSPDGKQAVYISIESEIYLMSMDGNQQVLLVGPDSEAYSPLVWSPDGAQIAFVTYKGGVSGMLGIMTLKDGSIKQFNGSGYVTSLAWSPDGQYIAFDSQPTERGASGIEITIPSFEDAKSLTLAPGESLTYCEDGCPGDHDPAWSPDSKQIAYVSTRDGNSEIYSINRDGSNKHRLTNNSIDDGQPSWSLDGTKILFVSKRDGDYEIYVMDMDGNNPTRLTNNPADDGQPAWSPDGKQIAFTSDRDGNREIYLMNADGSNQTRLTNNDVNDWGPVWQPLPKP